MLHGYVPSDFTLRLLRWYVIYRNRHLSDYIPLKYRLEIYGASLGCPDPHPDLVSYYNRVLNYHGGHDVSYMMIDNPLVSKADALPSAPGASETVSGHLLTGPQLRLEARGFSRERVVIMANRTRHSFISLAWAGMAGVVSGMNRAGVFGDYQRRRHQGCRTRPPRRWRSSPVRFCGMRIISRKLKSCGRRRYSCHRLVIGSRADENVVVERTPRRCRCANPRVGRIRSSVQPFPDAGPQGRPEEPRPNEEAPRVAPDRLTELLKQNPRITRGSHKAVEICGIASCPAGNSPATATGRLECFDRHALDRCDLTAGIFWALRHLINWAKFVAF